MTTSLSSVPFIQSATCCLRILITSANPSGLWREKRGNKQNYFFKTQRRGCACCSCGTQGLAEYAHLRHPFIPPFTPCRGQQRPEDLALVFLHIMLVYLFWYRKLTLESLPRGKLEVSMAQSCRCCRLEPFCRRCADVWQVVATLQNRMQINKIEKVSKKGLKV